MTCNMVAYEEECRKELCEELHVSHFDNLLCMGVLLDSGPRIDCLKELRFLLVELQAITFDHEMLEAWFLERRFEPCVLIGKQRLYCQNF